MGYGEFLYGDAMYNESLMELLPPPEPVDRQADLMQYLTSNYHDGENIRRLIAIEEHELGQLAHYVEELEKQFCVDLSTWGLWIWEHELGIKADRSLSVGSRRELVRAKLRGYGTTTIERLKNIAEAFSGGEVDIEEHPDEFYFTVRFVGTRGIPRNMPAFIETLELIKPAHQAYEFAYTYTVWNMLPADMTWDEAELETWNSLRVWEEW